MQAQAGFPSACELLVLGGGWWSRSPHWRGLGGEREGPAPGSATALFLNDVVFGRRAPWQRLGGLVRMAWECYSGTSGRASCLFLKEGVPSAVTARCLLQYRERMTRCSPLQTFC